MEGGQKNVVLILARELAANIAAPLLVFDRDGTLVFFNGRQGPGPVLA